MRPFSLRPKYLSCSKFVTIQHSYDSWHARTTKSHVAVTEQSVSPSFSSVIPFSLSVIPDIVHRESRAPIGLSHGTRLLPTWQGQAILATTNPHRAACAMCHGDPHPGCVPTPLLWIPAFARMTDKGTDHFSALVNARRAIRALNSYEIP